MGLTSLYIIANPVLYKVTNRVTIRDIETKLNSKAKN